MNTKVQLICDKLKDFAIKNQSTDYSLLDTGLRSLLDKLAKEEVITFSDEYTLRGTYLERRVQLSLKKIGFNVQEGRPRKEDLVCQPPNERQSSHPLVWEVKSGHKPCASTEHLRQLDDWVFELSGESSRRVRSIETQRTQRTTIYPFGHLIPPHNTEPVKGVFLYNGYVGEPSVPFQDRPRRVALDANEQDFAQSRGFCALTFETLLTWEHAISAGRCNSLDFWDSIQQTLGELGACDFPK